MYCSHGDHKHVKNQSTKTIINTQHAIVITMYYFIYLETVSIDKSNYSIKIESQLIFLYLKLNNLYKPLVNNRL